MYKWDNKLTFLPPTFLSNQFLKKGREKPMLFMGSYTETCLITNLTWQLLLECLPMRDKDVRVL